MRAHGIRHSGYKHKLKVDERKEILSSLAGRLTLATDTQVAVENDDALDAIVCLLAAQDFLRGDAGSPEDVDLARREGWIWVGTR